MSPENEMETIKRRCDELIRLFYKKAALGKTLNLTFTYDDDLRAQFVMPYQEAFNHGLGDTHGGIIATLLDTAGWFTAAPHYDTWVATSDLHVQLLDLARQEELRAVGKLMRTGKRLAVAHMEVWSASERLVATGSGSFVVTTVPFTLEDKSE